MGNLKFNTIEELYAYINNPSNYKSARKKQYTIWACIPKSGTKVHNKLEDFDYVTEHGHEVVLSGTRGELYVTSLTEVANTYTYSDGSPITPESITEKSIEGMVDWFQIKTKPNSRQLWACFIPKQYQFQVERLGRVFKANRPRIPHGLGDFVICEDNVGKPNVASKYVVNGAVFADTYNNRGWQDCLEEQSDIAGKIPEKPRIPVIVKGTYRSVPVPEDVKMKYKLKATQEVAKASERINMILNLACSMEEEDITGDSRFTTPLTLPACESIFEYRKGTASDTDIFVLAYSVFYAWCSRKLQGLWKFLSIHKAKMEMTDTKLHVHTSDGMHLFIVANNGSLIVQVSQLDEMKNAEGTAVDATSAERKKQGKILFKETFTLKDITEFAKTLDNADNMKAFKESKNPDDLLKGSKYSVAKTKFSDTIMAATSAIFKQRPVTFMEVAGIVRELIGKSMIFVNQNGLEVKGYVNFEEGKDWATITINGDDDDNLKLSFKIDIKETTWGVKVKGKSNKKDYDKYFPCKNFYEPPKRNKTENSVMQAQMKIDTFVISLFLDICKMLEVSPYRRFFREESYQTCAWYNNYINNKHLEGFVKGDNLAAVRINLHPAEIKDSKEIREKTKSVTMQIADKSKASCDFTADNEGIPAMLDVNIETSDGVTKKTNLSYVDDLSIVAWTLMCSLNF